MIRKSCVLMVILVFVFGMKSVQDSKSAAGNLSVTADDAMVEKLCGGFKFTEGPISDKAGNVYFTDIPNNRIHKWSIEGKVSTFLENSGGANGLYFDKKGRLTACAGGLRQLLRIDMNGSIEVLAEKFEGKRFNSPNDLWIDSKGGVYFTDPRYGNRDNMELGEHVYYLSPDKKKLIRVIDDMVKPNGLIGSIDGKKLYVADPGSRKTFVYDINKDGSLSGKKLFAEQGSDGMTVDERGNIYLTDKGVTIYNPDGEKIETIEVGERPSNVCFGGKDNKTLFMTARTSFYSIEMNVKGANR
ncbi:MAG: SMP-30/gluconolactonase/LRE family protein [Planctomycetes bacterium]|nr:SMP-30/gluconolactonase/LRE family protein [Planctomycetota bacterium]